NEKLKLAYSIGAALLVEAGGCRVQIITIGIVIQSIFCLAACRKCLRKVVEVVSSAGVISGIKITEAVIIVSIFSLICSSENHYPLFKQLQCIVVFLVFIILHRSIVFHIHITAFANTVEAATVTEQQCDSYQTDNDLI